MRQVLVIAAALSLGFGGASLAADHPGPYKLDAKGNCHAADGKLARKALCSGAAAAAPASAASVRTAAAAPSATQAAAAHTYKLDAKGKCRDEKSKLAKQALCKA